VQQPSVAEAQNALAAFIFCSSDPRSRNAFHHGVLDRPKNAPALLDLGKIGKPQAWRFERRRGTLAALSSLPRKSIPLITPTFLLRPAKYDPSIRSSEHQSKRVRTESIVAALTRLIHAISLASARTRIESSHAALRKNPKDTIRYSTGASSIWPQGRYARAAIDLTNFFGVLAGFRLICILFAGQFARARRRRVAAAA